MQCQIQWLENDHPLINKTKWSIQETESLYQIVDEANSTDWKAIAETLGVSTPPFQPTKANFAFDL